MSASLGGAYRQVALHLRWDRECQRVDISKECLDVRIRLGSELCSQVRGLAGVAAPDPDKVGIGMMLHARRVHRLRPVSRSNQANSEPHQFRPSVAGLHLRGRFVLRAARVDESVRAGGARNGAAGRGAFGVGPRLVAKTVVLFTDDLAELGQQLFDGRARQLDRALGTWTAAPLRRAGMPQTQAL